MKYDFEGGKRFSIFKNRKWYRFSNLLDSDLKPNIGEKVIGSEK